MRTKNYFFYGVIYFHFLLFAFIDSSPAFYSYNNCLFCEKKSRKFLYINSLIVIFLGTSWYRLAGNEVLNPLMDEYFSQKFLVYLAPSVPPPKILVIFINYHNFRENLESQNSIKIDVNGFSQPDFQVYRSNGTFLQAYHFDFLTKNKIKYSLKSSKHSHRRSTYLFFRSDVDYLDPIFERSQYLSLDFDKLAQRAKDQILLESVVSRLDTFE